TPLDKLKVLGSSHARPALTPLVMPLNDRPMQSSKVLRTPPTSRVGTTHPMPGDTMRRGTQGEREAASAPVAKRVQFPQEAEREREREREREALTRNRVKQQVVESKPESSALSAMSELPSPPSMSMSLGVNEAQMECARVCRKINMILQGDIRRLSEAKQTQHDVQPVVQRLRDSARGMAKTIATRERQAEARGDLIGSMERLRQQLNLAQCSYADLTDTKKQLQVELEGMRAKARAKKGKNVNVAFLTQPKLPKGHAPSPMETLRDREALWKGWQDAQALRMNLVAVQPGSSVSHLTFANRCSPALFSYTLSLETPASPDTPLHLRRLQGMSVACASSLGQSFAECVCAYMARAVCGSRYVLEGCTTTPPSRPEPLSLSALSERVEDIPTSPEDPSPYYVCHNVSLPAYLPSADALIACARTLGGLEGLARGVSHAHEQALDEEGKVAVLCRLGVVAPPAGDAPTPPNPLPILWLGSSVRKSQGGAVSRRAGLVRQIVLTGWGLLQGSMGVESDSKEETKRESAMVVAPSRASRSRLHPLIAEAEEGVEVTVGEIWSQKGEREAERERSRLDADRETGNWVEACVRLAFREVEPR
ncbi:hypothetical protein KIPB_007453, partial [Kipferlia bialata]